MEPRRGILAARSPSAALALVALLWLTHVCGANDPVLDELPEGVLWETVSVSAGLVLIV
jgi:hypothetical protein